MLNAISLCAPSKQSIVSYDTCSGGSEFTPAVSAVPLEAGARAVRFKVHTTQSVYAQI